MAVFIWSLETLDLRKLGIRVGSSEVFTETECAIRPVTYLWRDHPLSEVVETFEQSASLPIVDSAL